MLGGVASVSAPPLWRLLFFQTVLPLTSKSRPDLVREIRTLRAMWPRLETSYSPGSEAIPSGNGRNGWVGPTEPARQSPTPRKDRKANQHYCQ